MERCGRDLFTEAEGLLLGFLCRNVMVGIFYLGMRKERLGLSSRLCGWRDYGINTCNKEADNRC